MWSSCENDFCIGEKEFDPFYDPTDVFGVVFGGNKGVVAVDTDGVPKACVKMDGIHIIDPMPVHHIMHVSEHVGGIHIVFLREIDLGEVFKTAFNEFVVADSDRIAYKEYFFHILSPFERSALIIKNL